VSALSLVWLALFLRRLFQNSTTGSEIDGEDNDALVFGRTSYSALNLVIEQYLILVSTYSPHQCTHTDSMDHTMSDDEYGMDIELTKELEGLLDGTQARSGHESGLDLTMRNDQPVTGSDGGVELAMAVDDFPTLERELGRIASNDQKGAQEDGEPALQGSQSNTNTGLMDIEESVPMPLAHKSPFDTFRKKGFLSVSDLVGTVWCEVQVSWLSMTRHLIAYGVSFRPH
jgi:hypothetical protein